MDRQNEHLLKSGMTTFDVTEMNTTNISKCKPINCLQGAEGRQHWSEHSAETTTTSDRNICSKRKYIATGQDRDYNEEDFVNQTTDMFHIVPSRKKIKQTEEENNSLKLLLTRKEGTDQFKSQFKSLNSTNDNAINTVTEMESMKIVSERHVDSVSEYVDSGSESFDSASESFDSASESFDSASESFNSASESFDSASESVYSVSESVDSVSESVDSVSYSNKEIKRLRCRDAKTLMTEHRYKIYIQFFEIPIFSKNIENDINLTGSPKNGKYLAAKNEYKPVFEIEKIYNKYFSKTVQDSIAIIANILNTIIITNRHFKFQMGECNKNPNLALKKRLRWNTSQVHAMHTKILETKLKKHFMNIILSITDSVDTEFELTIQMVNICILNVFKVLNHPVFRITNILKMLVYIASRSLQNSEFEYPKFYSIINSNSFSSHCYDLLKRVEDSRENDPGIIDHMPLFFISTINGQEYFNAVTAAITSNSNEDIALLVNNAEVQYHVNSRFKEPLNYSALIINNCINMPVTTVPKAAKHIYEDKHGTVTQATNGTYQSLSINNERNIQINITLEPTPPNTPLNTYETISSTPHTNVISKLDTTENMSSIMNVVYPTSVASTSLSRPTTLNSFNPTIHNQYNTLTEGHEMQKTYNSNISDIGTKPSTVYENILKCFASNCPNSATIICSFCISAQYCSYHCQQNLHWFLTHQYDCTQLQLFNINNIQFNKPNFDI